MGRIYELDKDSAEVTVLPNIVGQISTVVSVEVPPTKAFTVYPNADLKLFLQTIVPADLPDDTQVELWVVDVAGDEPKRIREWKLARFNNVNQYNNEEKVTLDIERAVLLPELHKIEVRILSSALLDWTVPTSNFLFQVDRTG